MWRGGDNGWLRLCGPALGIGTLYLCSPISFDTVIARHNLSMPVGHDGIYLGTLGESSVPVILAYQKAHNVRICPPSDVRVTVPADWREWGFRNWRARRSLAGLYAEVSP